MSTRFALDHRHPRSATAIKLLLFDFVAWAWLGIFFDTGSRWRIFFSLILGLGSLVCWDSFVAKRQLRDMAEARQSNACKLASVAMAAMSPMLKGQDGSVIQT